MTNLATALEVAKSFYRAETIDVCNHNGSVKITDLEDYMDTDVTLIQGDEKHVDIWLAL